MTETLSKLYLELAHAVPEGTKTFRELALEKRIEELENEIERLNKIWKHWYDQAQKELSNQIKAEKRIEELEAEVETLSAAVSNAIGDGAMAVAAERERICRYIKSREMWARLRDKNGGEIPHTIAYAIREKTDK